MLAAIGHNQPPSAIELAKPTIEDLGRFLSDHPVIVNEDEARTAKLVADRVLLAFKGMEEERDSKVRPLNEQVATVNAEYHKWFNTNDKKPGVWGTLLKELKIRLTAYAKKLEAERQATAEAARKAAAEAARKAKEAEDREREAAAEAAAGVCGVDIAAAKQEADDAFAEFERADRISERALRDTKVRIGGGFGNVATLRNKETLTVTDWKAAVEEMTGDDGVIPAKISDAIIMCARAYRQVMDQLPAGIESHKERTL